MPTSPDVVASRPLVIFEHITGEIARVLHDVGCGYADASGVLYLPDRDLPGRDLPAHDLVAQDLPAHDLVAQDLAVGAGAPSDRVAASVRWAIREQIAEAESRFALVDLLSGGGDQLAARDLTHLPRRPERILNDPIALLAWLVTLPVTLRVHSNFLTYLACSDPDEILPSLPWHTKGPDRSLDGVELFVPAASVVSAVEVLEARDWRTGGDVLVLPNGSSAVLGGS